ncbi:hypothetical protein GPV46_23950, partial [Salmonella enterica subsp. enterica serovar Typhimurium]|nr:hypothetical protein [Salmonella enterica subsp. enterica serovar Typhimurium]
AVMTLNKDGSIAGYEIKEPFDPKKEAEKAQQLVDKGYSYRQASEAMNVGSTYRSEVSTTTCSEW